MEDVKFKKEILDNISPSFCGAKWYNATIWLGSGMTTSCHHPPAHQVDIEKVKLNPKLLHNTPQKKHMPHIITRYNKPRNNVINDRIDNIW